MILPTRSKFAMAIILRTTGWIAQPINDFVTVLRTTDLSCAVVWLPAHWSDVREETLWRYVGDLGQ